MCNRVIRETAERSGVKFWEIAAAWPCGDSTFTRRMRREFSPADTAKALEIIDRLAAEKAAANT